jgi:hypothetical protein
VIPQEAAAQVLTESDTIHIGHHDVADNQIHLILFQHLDGFQSISSQQHPVVYTEVFPQELLHVFVVFHHQHNGHFVTWFHFFDFLWKISTLSSLLGMASPSARTESLAGGITGSRRRRWNLFPVHFAP